MSLESEGQDCTLHLDRILNYRKLRKNERPFEWIYSPCNKDNSEIKEPGFYRLSEELDLRLNVLGIEQMFEDMLRYFTKVE